MSNVNIGSYTETYTSEKVPVGQLSYDGLGREFEFVKNEGTAATIAGQVVGRFSTAPGPGLVSMLATTVIESTLGTLMPVAGVAMAAAAEDEFLWIQRKGPNAVALVTDGTIAAGDPMVCAGGATPTFVADQAAAGGEIQVYGVALAADTSTALAIGEARLDCRY